MRPLAQKLGSTGVFGDKVGHQFAGIVDGSTEQWEDVTALILNSRNSDFITIRSKDQLVALDNQRKQRTVGSIVSIEGFSLWYLL